MAAQLPLNIKALMKEIENKNKINNNNNEMKVDMNKKNSVKSKERKGFDKNDLSLVNGFRIVLIFVCLVWFTFNAYTIIKKYLAYDTIVSLRMEPPETSDLPGITVCGPYVMSPITLAKLFTNKYKYEKFNAIVETDINYNKTEINVKKKLFDEYEQKAFETYSAIDILNNYSLKYDDLIIKCSFNSINLRHDSGNDKNTAINCSLIKPIVESIYEGRKCFTFFSQMYKSDNAYNDLKMSYDLNPSIEMTLNISDNFWGFGCYAEQVIMTVHPPGIIPTHLDFEYIRVLQQFYYEVYFTKKSSHLKKKPWKTGCKDYGSEGKWRMREDCVNDCIKQLTFPKHGCANYHGVLYKDLFNKNDKICGKKSQDYKSYVEARRECVNRCSPECTQVIYEIFDTVQDMYDSNACKHDNDVGCVANIVVQIHHSPFMFINHTEAFTTEEFIGTIGGHMGIWLGLSAIAFFDLILTFLEKIKLSLKAKKLKSKK